MRQDRDRTRTWALLLALGVTGCAADPADPSTGFGPASAGPTRSSAPAPDTAPATAPASPDDAAPPDGARQDRSLCGLFTTREVSRTLGLAVEPVAAEVEPRGEQVTCTWHASREPRVPSWRRGDPVLATDDGIVTVTRAPAAAYRRLEREITATARRENADAREEVPGVGLAAFAIGSSVSGVPIWHAMALHGEVVTAVEVTGADSRAGLVTVTDFLAEVVARG